MVRYPLPVRIRPDPPAEGYAVATLDHWRTIVHDAWCPHRRASLWREEAFAHHSRAEHRNARCRAPKTRAAPGIAVIVGRGGLDGVAIKFIGNRIVCRIRDKVRAQRQAMRDDARNEGKKGQA